MAGARDPAPGARRGADVQDPGLGAAVGAPQALDARFRDVRAATLALARPLSAEDCALQSMPDASPVKWHLAHTTWFFEAFVLEPFARGYRPIEPAYRMLFNSYYTALGERYPRPQRGLLSRPSLDEVLAYRRWVDEAVSALGTADPAAAARIELGLHHEQQHQELLLTDVKHLLSHNPLAPRYATAAPAGVAQAGGGGSTGALRWIAHEGGLHDFGHDGGGFAFDNEGPRHRAFVAPFALASRLVTNAEFMAFVEDGGYRRPELWLSAGFDEGQRAGWEAPLYWRHGEGGWTAFTLHGEAPLDPCAPVVHVSHYEADAYARWAGARLPTEQEWELAARAIPVEGNFVESGVLAPLPAGDAPASVPAQLYGDCWEWTQSAYLPYPGFRAGEGAIGEYNGKFMSGQMVLRGGSCATPRSHIRATYRNFFPPSARWQFGGIRLARDA